MKNCYHITPAKLSFIVIQHNYIFPAVVMCKYYNGVPIPVQLRHLELMVGIDGWMMKIFVRSSGELSQGSNYSSGLQLLHNTEMFIELQADLRLQWTSAVNFMEQLSVDGW